MMQEIIRKEMVMQLTGLGSFTAGLMMRFLYLTQINRIYHHHIYPAEGLEFIQKTFQHLSIKVSCTAEEQENIPVEGAFISISNHPFGFLDGLTTILLIASVRPDYKITANFLLENIAPLKNYFLFVNPFEGTKNKNMGGTQRSLAHLAEGKPLGLFPAGEVSTWYKGQQGVKDRHWTISSIRLIQMAQVPVLPIFFHGQNSLLFHLLGKIHPLLRTVRLPAEFLNKKNYHVKVNIGKAISVDRQKECKTLEELRDYLRNSVYLLQSAPSNLR